MALKETTISRRSEADEVTLTNSGAIIKIKNDGVDALQIKNAAVTEDKLATDAVTTIKIKAAAVTRPKLALDIMALIYAGL